MFAEFSNLVKNNKIAGAPGLAVFETWVFPLAALQVHFVTSSELSG